MNELKRRAIGLLARRERSRAELAGRLAAHGTQEEIDALLEELTRSGLLSDARFAQAYLRANAARYGAARLRQALRQKGVDGDLVESELAAADAPDEMARARAVWAKKFAALPADAKDWARQARFLQSRGFSTDVIRKLLKEPS